ncbi:MAG: alpha/beta hydrolase [Anaerolineae bacterium]
MNPAQDRFIQAGDVRLHVREWGSDDLPPLVLLHGLASTSRMFDLIAPPLSAYFHVIVPDQRGHGLSDKPDAGYDFETISRDLDHLLDACGIEQAALIGHSWGAYSTVCYAATRPARVARAALIDGGVRPLGDLYATWAEAEIKMSPPTYHNRTVADIERMIRDDWLGAAFRPELLPLALSVFDTSDPTDVRAHLKRDHHMQIARAIWEMRPADYYPQVKCPLLIVNAGARGEDAAMVAYIDAAERPIDRVQVVWMPDTIHDIPWQRPDALVAVLDPFLRASDR